jgi:Na+-driven multidrug efflux pump
VFGLPGILAMPYAFRVLGASPDVAALAVRFGVLQCITLPLLLVSFSVYTAFRGVGRPGLGASISLVGACVTLCVDPLLIFGIGPFPRLEILGASIASSLGYFTVTAWGFVALASHKSPVRVRWLGPPYPHLGETLHMARVGLPSGVSNLSNALFGNALVKLVAAYGTTAVALFGMSQKFLRFGGVVVAGLGLGSSALIGQHLGAGRLDRAWLCSVMTQRVATAVLFVFSLVTFVAAEPIVRMFFRDPAVVPPGALYLRVLAVGLPFIGLSAGADHAYSGAGRNAPPMLLQVAGAWLITIPMMILLGRTLGFGPAGTMAGVAVGQMVAGLSAVWLVRQGWWLTHRV